MITPKDFLVPDCVTPLDWGVIFSRPAPLAVEVGCGKGEFLARLALARPPWNFLGIEIRPQRAVKIAERLAREGAENARVFCAEGRAVFFRHCAVGEIREIYCNFPDPWIKRSQRWKRLLDFSLALRFSQVLSPGGTIHLATDVADYRDQMLATFSLIPALVNTHGPGQFSLDGGDFSATIHEEKFRRAGRTCFYLRFVKKEIAA